MVQQSDNQWTDKLFCMIADISEGLVKLLSYSFVSLTFTQHFLPCRKRVSGKRPHNFWKKKIFSKNCKNFVTPVKKNRRKIRQKATVSVIPTRNFVECFICLCWKYKYLNSREKVPKSHDFVGNLLPILDRKMILARAVNFEWSI